MDHTRALGPTVVRENRLLLLIPLLYNVGWTNFFFFFLWGPWGQWAEQEMSIVKERRGLSSARSRFLRFWREMESIRFVCLLFGCQRSISVQEQGGRERGVGLCTQRRWKRKSHWLELMDRFSSDSPSSSSSPVVARLLCVPSGGRVSRSVGDGALCIHNPRRKQSRNRDPPRQGRDSRSATTAAAAAVCFPCFWVV